MALFKFIAFIGAVAMLIAVAPPSPAILFYAQLVGGIAMMWGGFYFMVRENETLYGAVCVIFAVLIQPIYPLPYSQGLWMILAFLSAGYLILAGLLCIKLEKARAAADFRIFAPHLQKLLDLKMEYLSFFEPAEHPYDILLDRFDEGMTCAALTRLFSRLKKEQGAVIREALAKEKPDDSFLKRKYPAAKQLSLTRRVLTRMGYDWNCGRQDRSVHPFTTSFGLYDVRITTKVVEGKPFSALFSSIHEGGHALYEQGIDKKYARTPFADGASFSIHESQSRLWENLVGRSPEFWNYWFPVVRNMFPGTLDSVSPEEFLAALNAPEASPIRTEADELTYNMHIILRFELEKSLIEGKMKVTELADAWNAGMKELLGIEVRNDTEGVLQDIHWAMGEFGYFPSYALGNVISAQLWNAALKQIPSIPDSIAHGEYAPLREWLRCHVHVFGAKYNTAEILARAAGSPELDAGPYLNMLKEKYC